MSRFVRHLFTLLFVVLVVSACSSKPENIKPDTTVFGFSVDPINQTVTINEANAASLSSQQTSGEPRVLTNTELQLASYDFAFLPGNILRIEASFINQTKFSQDPSAFSQLSFRPDNISSNINSVEPTVTADDLGGDGILQPAETTKQLIFEVEHAGVNFNYRVVATAVVTSVSTDICTDPGERVLIPDDLLRREIERSLQKTDITCTDMQTLEGVIIRSNGVTTLAGLQTAINLKALVLTGFQGSIDLETISGLTQLESLELPSSRISDLTPLTNLTELTHLELRGNRISDLTPLTNLTELTFLDLSINKISDVTPLSNKSKLIELRIGRNQISHVTPLNSLKALVSLELRDSRQLKNVTLSSLPELKAISLFGDTAVETLVLNDLPKLLAVNLSRQDTSGQLKRVELSNLDSIEQLVARDHQISELSITNLPNLVRLDLPENQLSDQISLENLPSLRSVILGDNRVSDLTPFQNFTNLTNLDLTRNQIDDVALLSEFVELDVLGLGDNQITDLSPLVANPDWGQNFNSFFIWGNCLDLTEGSVDLVNLQTLKERSPDARNFIFEPQKTDCSL